MPDPPSTTNPKEEKNKKITLYLNTEFDFVVCNIFLKNKEVRSEN